MQLTFYSAHIRYSGLRIVKIAESWNGGINIFADIDLINTAKSKECDKISSGNCCHIQ